MIERTVIFSLASSSEAIHMTFFSIECTEQEETHSHAHNPKIVD